MTNADRILELLKQRPGLDDDEISRLTGIQPRQQVNQICRRLETHGRLERKPSAAGKICNFLTTASMSSGYAPPVASKGQTSAQMMRSETTAPENASINLANFHSTLLLIPCSGRKNPGGAPGGCPPITDSLPVALTRRLMDARINVLTKAGLDDRLLMPAWQRYAGTLYTYAARSLVIAVNAGLHVLIISGGYGVIRACEMIGNYSTRLTLSSWPAGLLEDVLCTYAARHRLQRVRAFVSQSTDYYRVVARAHWHDAGVTDAVAITPEATRGAMVKTPRAQGEAMAAFLAGTLTPAWRSSDGLSIETHQL